MPTPTYTLIDSVTLGSSASSVTFSSIDQTFGDLVLVFSGTGLNNSYYIEFNADATSSNYSYVRMVAFASPGSGSGAFPQVGSIDNVIGNNISQIMDYSATDKHKTTISRANFSDYTLGAYAMRWANTSAITSLKAYADNSFDSGCTLFLYGIAKAL
jgi:hypothetical protein